MKTSLRLKLTLAFLILITVPISILGSITYNMSSKALQTSIEQQLVQNTSQTAELIEKTINSSKAAIQQASLNSLLGRIENNAVQADKDEAFQYIHQVKENNQDFLEAVTIVDTNGQAIMDSDSKSPNLNISDRDYFKTALSGSEAVSQVLISKVTGKPAILVAYPLKYNDRIVGVITGRISFSTISDYAKRIKVGNSGYAYMIDKNGLLVYHPDSSKILKENLSDTTSKDLKALVEQMKAGSTSQGFYTYQGIKKYVAFKPVGNWVVAITAEYNDYMAPAVKIRNATILISLIAIILAILCAYLFSSRSIINPIKKLEKLMSRAGEGDLNVKISIKSNDEIKELGDSFNTMIAHQHEIVRNVLSSAQQLNAASEEMAASTEEIDAASEEINASMSQVAQDAENQNNSIITISEVLVQLSSLVQLAKNRAGASSTNADHTMEVAHLGRLKVDETVKAIDMISKGTDETAKALEELSNLSVQVAGVVNTINAISEQTNLLALNAAIEAARAGENGKGFSVVADEVRKLSEESKNKAKAISALVDEMIQYTKNAVNSMERSKSEVKNGVIIVSETDEAFVKIINAVKDIVDNVGEILEITNDEVASSDQIVKLINEMATMTESTSSVSENVSSAANDQLAAIEGLTSSAQETSAMAEELTNLVERFKI